MDRVVSPTFFTRSLAESDPDVMKAINLELERQQNQIELIASENIVSRAKKALAIALTLLEESAPGEKDEAVS